MQYPALLSTEVSWIDAAAMLEIDRIMVADIGITLPQMMENAGRSLASLALEHFAPASVVVLVGSGGNGGGGLVAARHLHNWGLDVALWLSSPNSLVGTTKQQLQVAKNLGIRCEAEFNLGVDLVLDAMVGYSLRGALQGAAARAAESINASEVDVLALDLPSGLDATTGTVAGRCVNANATMTLCLPKVGLRDSEVAGELFLADISLPTTVTESFGNAPTPPFSKNPILHLVD